MSISKTTLEIIIPLIGGFIIDLIIGDPKHIPHPIKAFGKVISFLEPKINKGRLRTMKGTLMTIGLLFCVAIVFFLIWRIIVITPYLYYPAASILVFFGLANRNLIDEVRKVNQCLDQNLQEGRKQLSTIVGRDTTNLSANQIRIASLETLSENLSDGVIAPLFYFALGGIPFLFVYKMVNTLDSMIGYRNERYLKFGMFAAHTDDVFNYIPARITAILMVLISFSGRGLRYLVRFGPQHTSVNSGYPEAALAGILDCRFGGPNVYHGLLVNKPYIGEHDREIVPADIHKACMLNMKVSILMVLLILIVYLLIR